MLMICFVVRFVSVASLNNYHNTKPMEATLLSAVKRLLHVYVKLTCSYGDSLTLINIWLH